MEIDLKLVIKAVVTTDDRLVTGGVPVFIAKNQDEMDNLSFTLGKVLDGVVHQLKNEVYIIVSH